MFILAGALLIGQLQYHSDSIPVSAHDTLPKILQEIVVSATRIPEQALYAPVSIVKLDRENLGRIPAPSFFDALENVKGVQMITPSLCFKVMNMRGFANTTNVRFTQMADGMDLQAPHIGAPIGNALGPTDLDIESVEIIPGSSAVLYGMNTINGLSNFSTKSAFTDQGLQLQQKTGINHISDPDASIHAFTETTLRWAHAFNTKFAVKMNASYNRGYDWIADDISDQNAAANSSTGLTGKNNPGADPVNSYGNESSNRRTLALNGKNYVVARTGFYEKEVADFNLSNIKGDIALHYKSGQNTEFIYTYRMAYLNSLYQRTNRFRLQDYLVQQHGMYIRHKAFSMRMYLNRENTGTSYNIRSTAENIDRAFKSDDRWFSDYTEGFNQSLQTGTSVTTAHQYARTFADAGRPVPGSAAFQSLFDQVIGINNWDVGSALRVKASMLHAEAQYNLSSQINSWTRSNNTEALIGADQRTYFIMPDGNYFINPAKADPFKLLAYSKTGGFLSATQKVLKGRLRLGGIIRVDKNDYFSLSVNPRVSAVYAPDREHSFRLSYQTGNRFPSIFEAFSNVNSGGVKRVGGLPVMSHGIFEDSWLRVSVDAFQSAVLKDRNNGMSLNDALNKNRALLVKNAYTYLKPEHIRSLEMGYKGAFLNSRLDLDIDFYYNRYNDFIAQVEVNVPKTSGDSLLFYLNDKKLQSRYRMWTNSRSVVYNYGGSAGLTYHFDKEFTIGGNATFSRLDRKTNSDGREDGYNTPEWMWRLYIQKEEIWKRFGASLSGRWQSSYYWQSSFVNGMVPASFMLDAQVAYHWKTLPLQLRAGATNLLNHYVVTFLGGPSIGGLYYTTINYQFK